MKLLSSPISFLVPVILLGSVFLGQGPSPDFTSDKDGKWQNSSTWVEGGNPACNTANKVLIDGDTVTCDCGNLKVQGSGSITIKNNGFLEVKSDLEISGNANVEVGNSAGLKVNGNCNVSGNGGFTSDGNTQVTGDLNVSGSGVADGSGTLELGGSGCSNFTGSGSCTQNAPLPVELVSLEAEARNNGVRIQWVTASEKNNRGFAIQRSRNGLSYESVGELEGAGTTNERNEYEFIDEEDLNEGTYYYRLLQTDIDGKTEIHGPESVIIRGSEEECEMAVVPNPCPGNCEIRFSEGCEEKEGPFYLEVYDITGNKVMTKVKNQNSGLYLEKNNNMTPGIYIVRAASRNNKVDTKKVRIQ